MGIGLIMIPGYLVFRSPLMIMVSILPIAGGAFLGYLGIHRFYVGKIATGILWLVTGGIFGVGWLIDLILIAAGRFRDYLGYRLVVWEEPVSSPGPGRV